MSGADDSRREALQTLRDHEASALAVIDVFQKANLTPEQGELICAWILGSSLGARQQSVLESSAIRMLATAWAIAADQAT